MRLTPLDIRHQDFKRGLRGYSDVEVDEFLDRVADEFERLFKENIDYAEQVEQIREQLERYQKVEQALQSTLLQAQRSSDELRSNAKKESELILREASQRAQTMVTDAYRELQQMNQTLTLLRRTEEDFRFRMRALLESYLRQIDAEKEQSGTRELDAVLGEVSELVRQTDELSKAKDPALADPALQENQAFRPKPTSSGGTNSLDMPAPSWEKPTEKAAAATQGSSLADSDLTQPIPLKRSERNKLGMPENPLDDVSVKDEQVREFKW